MSLRRAFTLIETIVALVLLQIAMLALAATAAVAARDLSDTLARRRALALVKNRTDALRAVACTSGGAGSQSHAGGQMEYWHVDATGAARAITDSVSVPLTRGHASAAVAHAWVLCGP